MAVKMGEFLGILMNITNKQTNQAYPEDDVRTKFKNQRVNRERILLRSLIPSMIVL